MVYYLLGEEVDQVLSKLKVDIHLADLQAAYGFLVDYDNKQHQK